MRWFFLIFQSCIMKHFVQKKDFLEVSGSWVIWLWSNSPGKLYLKIKSSGRHWKNLPSDLSSLLGKTVSQITYLSIADHASGHTIKMNSPDCFVSWFHMEMRCSCTASPSRKAEFVRGPSPQFTDLAMSTRVTPSSCTPHWPLAGKGRGNFQEISQIHRTWGSISFSARRTTFSFFCYLLASKVWWKTFVSR